MTDLALLLGGAVGGVLRMLLELAAPTPDQFPLGTFVINLVGAFILTFFYTIADIREWSPIFRSGFGTGMVGAFTTFSTFCLETSDLLWIHWYLAVLYGVGSLILGLLMASAGQRLAEGLAERTFRFAGEEEDR